MKTHMFSIYMEQRYHWRKDVWRWVIWCAHCSRHKKMLPSSGLGHALQWSLKHAKTCHPLHDVWIPAEDRRLTVFI